MDNRIFFTSSVSKAQAGMRLDVFLRQELPQFSRAAVQRLIVGGNVTSDEIVLSDKDFKVRENDSYTVTVPPPQEADPEPEDIALDIVYEDDDLLVVNKPAGMTVHPAPGAYSGTLVNALLFHCRNSLSGVGGVKRPGIVHRIDKDTSGLLVVAKNDFAHQGLAEQFFVHSIERTYYAVVYGVPQPPEGVVCGNIARSRFDRKKMALVQLGGKSAITHYKTLAANGGEVSLVQCNLETGRTHQIRVHMSSKGCNLVGDKLYEKSGKTRINLPAGIKDYVNNFPRQALHAASLGFVHPRSRQKMSFAADFPPDMQELLQVTALNAPK